MNSLINWEVLRGIIRPPGLSHLTEEEQYEMWSTESVFYDRIIQMESLGTRNVLDCLPLTKEDSVLDVGCGPGRITSQLSKLVGKVTALDFSEKMLEKCREKVGDYPNINTVLMNWNQAEPDVNLPRHDIVIASRSIGGEDVKKLSNFAKKYAVLIGWANAPSIPEVRSALFDNARKEGSKSSFHYPRDRRIQYNLQYNIVYDLGYEPNIQIVPDGFERTYASKEEAYADILQLNSSPDEIDLEIFRKNVDLYLTGSDTEGYRFFFETRSFVMWWETFPKRFTLN